MQVHRGSTRLPRPRRLRRPLQCRPACTPASAADPCSGAPAPPAEPPCRPSLAAASAPASPSAAPARPPARARSARHISTSMQGAYLIRCDLLRGHSHHASGHALLSAALKCQQSWLCRCKTSHLLRIMKGHHLLGRDGMPKTESISLRM